MLKKYELNIRKTEYCAYRPQHVIAICRY